MKKFSVYFATALLVALSFVSCKKDDNGDGGGGGSSAFDGTISGKIVNPPAGIGDFTLGGYYGYIYGTPDISTTVHNGAFSLTLTAPPAGKLSPFSDHYPGAQPSDPNVRMAEIDFGAGSYGGIICASANGNLIAHFIYVDNDVTVSGTYNDVGLKLSYNMSLKRGWNKVLATWTSSSETYTTDNIPSNLVWQMEEYDMQGVRII